MSDDEVKFSQVRKRPITQRIRETVYQSDQGTVFGRDGKSWGKIGLFYLIFYGCLALFFIGAMMIFKMTLSNDGMPKLVGYDTPIKKNPGMGFRPQPDRESNSIKFVQGVPSSYEKYTNDITEFLKKYENQTHSNFVNCSDEEDVDPQKVCTFDVSTIMTKCKPPNFGYNEGQPCVLLKLNKIFDWAPTNDSDGNDGAARHIKITCGGLRKADEGRVGDVEIFPPEGIPYYYYPYRNQENYLQPLVFARFTSITNEKTVNVWCKAWAGNIYHHRNDKAGSVAFSLRVD